MKLDVDFQGLLEMADFRYPGDMFDPPIEEAEMALRAAEKIVLAVGGKNPQSSINITMCGTNPKRGITSAWCHEF